MGNILLYPVGTSDSCRWASYFLEKAGFSLTDHPSPEITHLLLDVPSFDKHKNLQNGSDFRELLRMLPTTLTVIGGNLNHDSLVDYRTIDLLQDSYFLAQNAAITAECALRVASSHLSTIYAESPALILGWGRIGKCLAELLSSIGCSVTVAARKENDRAMLKALGYNAVDFPQIPEALCDCRILFNTVPEVPLHSDILDRWQTGIAIDLASLPGMKGQRVIPARGLPGKYAPESAGRLICETILRMQKEEAI